MLAALLSFSCKSRGGNKKSPPHLWGELKSRGTTQIVPKRPTLARCIGRSRWIRHPVAPERKDKSGCCLAPTGSSLRKRLTYRFSFIALTVRIGLNSL